MIILTKIADLKCTTRVVQRLLLISILFLQEKGVYNIICNTPLLHYSLLMGASF